MKRSGRSGRSGRSNPPIFYGEEVVLECLLKAAKLAELVFERKSHSDADADWLGDDEHEAWGALRRAIAQAAAPVRCVAAVTLGLTEQEFRDECAWIIADAFEHWVGVYGYEAVAAGFDRWKACQ